MLQKIMLAAFCGIAACAPLHAQKIAYSYDSGGNRTQKRIIVLSAGAKGAWAALSEKGEEYITAIKVPEAQDSGIAIQTDGDSKVTVTVSEEAWAREGVISVFSANGQLVARKDNTDTLELDALPAGTYVISVESNGKIAAYKYSLK